MFLGQEDVTPCACTRVCAHVFFEVSVCKILGLQKHSDRPEVSKQAHLGEATHHRPYEVNSEI